MAEYLLDASALIDWLKGKPEALDLLAALVAGEHVLGVNAITIAETYSGFSQEEREHEEAFLSSFLYWPIDREMAELAGAYRYKYTRLGQPKSVQDMLMAAHAVRRDATLITANVRDFPMPELKILPLPGG